MHPEDFDDDRRSFERKPFKINAHLTPLWQDEDNEPVDDSFQAIEAITENLSAGGGLFEFTDHITNSTYYLIQLESDDERIPRLVLGQIKWSDEYDENVSLCGIEFIVEEELTPQSIREQIERKAPEALDFDEETREKLNKFLKGLTGEEE